jgi:hypothetical protein
VTAGTFIILYFTLDCISASPPQLLLSVEVGNPHDASPAQVAYPPLEGRCTRTLRINGSPSISPELKDDAEVVKLCEIEKYNSRTIFIGQNSFLWHDSSCFQLSPLTRYPAQFSIQSEFFCNSTVAVFSSGKCSCFRAEPF